MKIFLTGIMVISLFISAAIVIRKRKAHGITGIRTVLNSICFFLIAITNLIAFWLGFLGIWSWASTVVLLLLAGYFTKYMKPAL